MPTDHIEIPSDLLQLKPSAEIESVPLSRFLHKSASVLQNMLEIGQSVTVSIHDRGAMVLVSRRQYDEMVELICQIREKDSGDDSGGSEPIA